LNSIVRTVRRLIFVFLFESLILKLRFKSQILFDGVRPSTQFYSNTRFFLFDRSFRKYFTGM